MNRGRKAIEGPTVRATWEGYDQVFGNISASTDFFDCPRFAAQKVKPAIIQAQQKEADRNWQREQKLDDRKYQQEQKWRDRGWGLISGVILAGLGFLLGQLKQSDRPINNEQKDSPALKGDVK